MLREPIQLEGAADSGILSSNGQTVSIEKHLGVHPPEDPAKTPPILSFNRKREVEIPWATILEDAEVTDAGPITAIRQFFERSWQLSAPVEEVLAENPDALGTFVVLLSEEQPAYRSNFDQNPNTPTAEKVTSGIVLKHGTSGRWYLLHSMEGKQLEEKDFQQADAYTDAWLYRIDGTELVFGDTDAAATAYTGFEEIDLRPAFIQRRYQELVILKNMAETVSNKANEVSQNLIEKIVTTTADTDEIEQVMNKMLRLEMSAFDAEKQIERLATQAANLGYLLYLGETTDSKDRENGKLYTTYRRISRWTTTHTRTEKYTTGALFWKKTHTRKVKYTRTYQKTVQAYREVDTSRDLLAEKRDELLGQGMEVFLFDQTSDGFRTIEGTSLSQVVDRCQLDESFRRNCAVILPVYEESLTGDRVTIKYSVFLRPLPGIVPSILPRLSIEESLTYRSSWQRNVLGELVSSINLAAGEERTININREFERETNIVSSSTSVFDLSQSESNDLASEMENQTRQESERNRDLQLSSKVSGGNLAFSAEASATAGVSSSLKEMSQSISKTAQRAARSVSRQQREEVSTNSTSRTLVSNRNQSTAVLKNINQGRSLNLFFYRLYNQYRGGLFLENLQFNVLRSVETIAGSGVHESITFSLEEFARLMDEFSQEKLPFSFSDPKQQYLYRVAQTIDRLLIEEYGIPPQKEPSLRSARSVNRLTLPPPSPTNSRSPQNDPIAELAERLKVAEIDRDTPMVSQDLLVASPGLYLDSTVGARAGTEPYSEQMREQEIRLRAAEVNLKQSEALVQRARAVYMTLGNDNRNANSITGVLPDTENGTLHLRFRMPLPIQHWIFRVDGTPQQQFHTNDTTNQGRNLVLRWDDAPDWLDDENLIVRIDLFDERTQTRITYL